MVFCRKQKSQGNEKLERLYRRAIRAYLEDSPSPAHRYLARAASPEIDDMLLSAFESTLFSPDCRATMASRYLSYVDRYLKLYSA